MQGRAVACGEAVRGAPDLLDDVACGIELDPLGDEDRVGERLDAIPGQTASAVSDQAVAPREAGATPTPAVTSHRDRWRGLTSDCLGASVQESRWAGQIAAGLAGIWLPARS